MAGPITWRNVDAPNNVGLLNGMYHSQQNALQGLTSLGDAFANFKTERQKANLDDFNAQLASRYRTPEEMQAAVASGEVDKLRQQFGSYINQNQAMAAPQARLEALRSQTEAGQKYAIGQRKVAEHDQQDTLLALAHRGDRTVLDKLGQYDFYNDAEAAQKVRDALHLYDTQGIQRAAGNLNLRNGLRDEKDLLAGREAEQKARQAVQEQQTYKDSRLSKLNQLAADQGVPVKNGIPDTSGLPPIQKQAFEALMEKEGLLAPTQTDTQFTQQLRQQLLAPDSGLTTAAAEQVMRQVPQLMAGNRDLAPEDQKRLEEQLAPVQQRSQMQLEQLEREYKATQKRNGFAGEAWNPEESTNDLLNFIQDEEKFDPVGFNENERYQLVEAVHQSLGKGIKVGDETLPLTPAMARMVLSKVKGNWMGVGEDFTEEAQKLFKDEAFLKQYRDGIRAHNDYLNKKQRIASEGAQTLKAQTAALRQQLGVAPPLNDITGALLRRQGTQPKGSGLQELYERTRSGRQ